MWLNIDKPTSKCTAHNDPKCRHVLDMKVTKLKGINEIKTDGGWLEFPAESAAIAYKKRGYENYEFSRCC